MIRLRSQAESRPKKIYIAKSHGKDAKLSSRIEAREVRFSAFWPIKTTLPHPDNLPPSIHSFNQRLDNDNPTPTFVVNFTLRRRQYGQKRK